jgi:hypothetical protein
VPVSKGWQVVRRHQTVRRPACQTVLRHARPRTREVMLLSKINYDSVECWLLWHWMLKLARDCTPHMWQRLRRAHDAGRCSRRPGLPRCLASWPCPTLSGLSTALQHMGFS